MLSSVFTMIIVQGRDVTPTSALRLESERRRAETTNTNECIANLEGVAKCEGMLSLTPGALVECCDAVRELAVDKCECNPAVDVLLGQAGAMGAMIYDLEPLCRLRQPFKWAGVKPRWRRDCREFDQRSYGCELTDVEIDAARLTTLLSFVDLFHGADDENQCFHTADFITKMETTFEPDARFNVPYGIGTYSGYSDIAEYLGITFQGLSHGFWSFTAVMDGSEPAFLGVSDDGKTWTQGVTENGVFHRGATSYSGSYLLMEANFESCDKRISTFDNVPTESLRDSVEVFVQSADLSKRWGLEDICRYHTTFCAGDPATRQFDSEEACLGFMRDLPLYSEKCGPNRPLAGNSLPCKFKHHFMIPANPALHCVHIGPEGSVDMNGKMKCHDEYECAEGLEESLEWPDVVEIGDATPPAVLATLAANNEGWEDEPLGCAILAVAE